MRWAEPTAAPPSAPAGPRPSALPRSLRQHQPGRQLLPENPPQRPLVFLFSIENGDKPLRVRQRLQAARARLRVGAGRSRVGSSVRRAMAASASPAPGAFTSVSTHGAAAAGGNYQVDGPVEQLPRPQTGKAPQLAFLVIPGFDALAPAHRPVPSWCRWAAAPGWRPCATFPAAAPG